MELGERRADHRTGVLAAAIVNSNPYRKKGSRAAKPWDFFPSTRPPSRRRPRAEVIEKIRSVFGGPPPKR